MVVHVEGPSAPDSNGDATAEAGVSEFQDLLTAIFDGALVVDAQQRILDANDSFAGMVGMSRDELRGQPLASLVTPAGTQVGLFTAGVVQQRISFRAKDGKPIRGEVRAVRLAGESGRALVVVSDLRRVCVVAGESGLDRRRCDQITTMVPAVIYRICRNRDGQFRLDYVSSSSESMLGVLPGDVIADPQAFGHLLHPDDSAAFWESLERSAVTGTVWIFSGRWLRDGEVRWFDTEATVRILRDDTVVWEGVLVDITGRQRALEKQAESENRMRALLEELAQEVAERRRVEAELRASQERYALAAAGANDGLWEWVAGEQRPYISRRCYELLGFPPDHSASVADFDADRVHEEDREAIILEISKAVRAGQPFAIDCRLRTYDDNFRWFNVRGQGVLGENGSLRDITDQRNFQEMRDRFVEKIIAAEDAERRRVARELHDETGQALTSLLVGLRAVEHEVENGTVQERLMMLRELTSQTLDEVGRLARGLHPSVLDDHGFTSAVERFVSEFSNHHDIAVDLHVRGLTPTNRMPIAVETTLYRVIQEALTNVARHAEAKTVSLIVERDRDGVQVIIEDDGKGFDVDRVLEGAASVGFGLHSIRERATQLRGNLAVESSPGKGTSLYLRVPARKGFE